MAGANATPVASGGSFVIARLGNKVGNVYRPLGGDYCLVFLGRSFAPAIQSFVFVRVATFLPAFNPLNLTLEAFQQLSSFVLS